MMYLSTQAGFFLFCQIIKQLEKQWTNLGQSSVGSRVYCSGFHTVAALELPGHLLKHRFLGWTPRVSDSLGLEWGPRICFPNMFPGEVHPEKPWCREKSLDLGIKTPVSLSKSLHVISEYPWTSH